MSPKVATDWLGAQWGESDATIQWAEKLRSNKWVEDHLNPEYEDFLRRNRELLYAHFPNLYGRESFQLDIYEAETAGVR